jgi:hypothetical protein
MSSNKWLHKVSPILEEERSNPAPGPDDLKKMTLALFIMLLG